MSARYITTTLPYINGDPHLGHALEFVEADYLARTLRGNGEEVFLNIGTDEHGTKVAQKAAAAGKDPQAYADEYATKFKSFAEEIQTSFDSFVRTTDSHHKTAAQEFWKRCEAEGDIYKATYEVRYCVGCELEKTDSELEHGHCPLHPNLEIELREEENYYFRFSKYQDALLELYKEQPDFLVPETRLKELTSFVSAGLKDFSISRRKESLSWGVSVPGDDEHVMYVWFDALTNYISVLGWPEDEPNFTKWWPGIQLAGKDNLRQQAAMWQAMLLSAGLPHSAQVFIHGFITSGGQKMSKSLGNVINPMDIARTYGVDALRYVLLRHMNPFEDSDLTEASVKEYYTAHLTNGLGNLVARVMKLAETHLDEPVTIEEKALPQEYLAAVEAFEFNRAMDMVWEHIGKLDERMTTEAPFALIKTDPEKGKALIAEFVQEVQYIGIWLAASMPKTSETILQAVRENKKPENLFPRL